MLAIFDLDNTLVDRRAAIRRWAALFLEREGLPTSLLGSIVERDRDGQATRIEFLQSIHQAFDLEGTVADLRAWYDESYLTCFAAEPESVRAIQSLRSEGWAVAVVSNGPLAGQQSKLRRAGLSELLEVLVTPTNSGLAKPDPRIFLVAAERAGVLPSGWAFGDDPNVDIASAAAAGFRTAWISHGREWPAGHSRNPDMIAHSLTEVVERVLTTVRRKPS